MPRVSLHGGGPAPIEAIAELEHVLGERLSPSVHDFLAVHDGARPDDNIFTLGTDNEAGVREFIPAAAIPAAMRDIHHLPEGSYPIAWDELGNAILIDERHGGAVLYWDHESGDLTAVAEDFGAFLEKLRPFDPRSVTLKPEQVLSVWVHPDLAKILQGNKE